jgi:sugar porter (SP) family MFS transporter
MFAATAVPAVLFLVAVIFVPESPRWLAKKGKHGKARAVLARIGGGAYAEASLAGIEETLVGESGKVNFRALLDRRLGRVLFLGVALAILQQWCGINVIFYYAKDIFAASGFAVSDVLLNIVIIGTANLVFTVVAMRTVDRLGRRPLMLFGYAGLAVLFLLLGLGFQVQSRGLHMLALVVLAIGCYGLTLAPITWVLISEIFPNRIRGAAVSVATTALWTACFLLTVTFPALNEKLGPAKTFWIYAAICVLGFVLFKRRLPETKGKTLEALEKELAG